MHLNRKSLNKSQQSKLPEGRERAGETLAQRSKWETLSLGLSLAR